MGRNRKRYLLLTSNRTIDPQTRSELNRLILERYPHFERKLVWLDKGLIVRTDLRNLPGMKVALALTVGETQLQTRSVSGSISKLKRMVNPGGR